MERRTEKPWGYEELITLNDRYCFKLLFVKAGHRTSLQYHRVKHETMYLLGRGDTGGPRRGRGYAGGPRRGWDGGTRAFAQCSHRHMGRGDTCELAPGTVHRIYAQQDATYLEASTPETGDVVRLEDDYGRA